MDFLPEENDNPVTAWRCRQGKIALDAAALVDTEVSRYYNRLTMYSEEDLKDEKGDFDKLIEFGKNRMQQKKYEMNDGDVVTFFAFDVPPDVVPPPPKPKKG
jgi:ribosome-binding ATPase YchF (GTP1/OBG family)